LRASLFSGAGKFTTHLLKLINIFWLSLCRINKFGFYFPSKTVVIPYTCGSSVLSGMGSAAQIARLGPARKYGPSQALNQHKKLLGCSQAMPLVLARLFGLPVRLGPIFKARQSDWVRPGSKLCFHLWASLGPARSSALPECFPGIHESGKFFVNLCIMV
jgi:hypothetical protein